MTGREMTCPEHFREAERLLASTKGSDGEVASDDATLAISTTLAAAQVHATLALAAATALPTIIAYRGDQRGERHEWTKATS